MLFILADSENIFLCAMLAKRKHNILHEDTNILAKLEICNFREKT